MEFANYQLDWPRENLSVRCFVHDVFNYPLSLARR